MTCYCPSSACAAAIPYEVIKPTICPKCRQPFAAAFKATPVAVAAPMVTTIAQPATPRVPSKLTQAAVKWKSKARPVARGGADADIDAQYGVAQDTVSDEGDDESPYDNETHARASELAATIDPSTIIVSDQDEGVYRFEQFEREAQAGRPAPQATPGKASAPKRRRKK